jgi:hypothetical protein
MRSAVFSSSLTENWKQEQFSSSPDVAIDRRQDAGSDNSSLLPPFLHLSESGYLLISSEKVKGNEGKRKNQTYFFDIGTALHTKSRVITKSQCEVIT